MEHHLEAGELVSRRERENCGGVPGGRSDSVRVLVGWLICLSGIGSVVCGMRGSEEAWLEGGDRED